MLIIEPKEGGQKCKTCPFEQNEKLTCKSTELNGGLASQIDSEFVFKGELACNYHSITIKPEYNGMD